MSLPRAAIWPSVHASGRAARAIVEEARANIVALIGARAQDLIFTSGGTEANALALFGAVQAAAEAGERITRLFVSAIEHDSVSANAELLAERVAGLRLERILVTGDGVVDLEALRVLLREGKGRTLMAVMAANNETGVIQPLNDVSRLAKDAGALLLVDAGPGRRSKMAFDFGDADYVPLSAHKLSAVRRKRVDRARGRALRRHDRGRRTGARPSRGYRKCRGHCWFLAPPHAPPWSDYRDDSHVPVLRNRFESELLRIAPDAVVFGRNAPRLENTSNFALPGIAAETALMALDLDGVMVSSGAACSSGKVKSSRVLAAMGISDDVARCALRASFGWNTNAADIDAAIALHLRLLERAAPRGRLHEESHVTGRTRYERTGRRTRKIQIWLHHRHRNGAGGEGPERGYRSLHLGQEGRAGLDAANGGSAHSSAGAR